MKKIFPLLILLLAVPLLGAESDSGSGCSCGRFGGGESGGGVGEGTGGENGGGGVARSVTYSMPRAEIGWSLSSSNSASNTYKATTTLGYFLSEGLTLSDHYSTFHPLSEDVVENSPALKAQLSEAIKAEHK